MLIVMSKCSTFSHRLRIWQEDTLGLFPNCFHRILCFTDNEGSESNQLLPPNPLLHGQRRQRKQSTVSLLNVPHRDDPENSPLCPGRCRNMRSQERY